MTREGPQNFKTSKSFCETLSLPLLPEILINIKFNSKILETIEIMNNMRVNGKYLFMHFES